MRKVLYLVSCLVLFLLTAVPMAAKEGTAGGKDKVVDMAGLLTDGEEEQLEERLRKIAEKYSCDVAVVTAASTGGLSPMAYADRFYEDHGYGVGPGLDGLILLISMEERDWRIETFGSAVQTFTDYGLETIGEEIVPELSDGEYDVAFEKFASLAEEFLEEAKTGEPYDVGHTYRKPVPAAVRLAVAFGAGLAAALGVLLALRSQLGAVGYGGGAGQYVRQGSFRLTRSRDLYLYRTVEKRKIEKAPPPDVRAGGSSTHTTPQGHQAGGRGGKF